MASEEYFSLFLNLEFRENRFQFQNFAMKQIDFIIKFFFKILNLKIVCLSTFRLIVFTPLINKFVTSNKKQLANAIIKIFLNFKK